MNNLALALAWLACQIAVVLVPALVIQALASRKGPAQGASAAALALALVMLLSVAALVPRFELPGMNHVQPPLPVDREQGLISAKLAPPVASDQTPTGGARLSSLVALVRLWRGVERGAVAPMGAGPTAGAYVAAVVLAGMAAGLARLLVGLIAIERLCRRASVVRDPEAIALLDDLRAAMGCKTPIDLRETVEIGTAATAGWKRPVVLLPVDWRDWYPAELRAVVAHELAHIHRRDYAVGLAARLVAALHSYHPLVQLTAARLTLEQELAADALAAGQAGGRARYLAALSRLALRQDGRSPCWPARAFLPRRGTLIRRIAMLRKNDGVESCARPSQRAWRVLAAVGLTTLTLAVAAVRTPARGEDKTQAPATKGSPAASAPRFFRDNLAGAVVIRPAAALKHPGVDRLMHAITGQWAGMLAEIQAGRLNIDPSNKGLLKIKGEDLEWVTSCLSYGRSRNPEEEEALSCELGGFAVRSIKPFDWLAFARQCGFETTATKESGRVYYKLEGPLKEFFGPDPCLYPADDRTAWVDDEEHIKSYLNRPNQAAPAFLTGPEWERACQGLLAVALDNHDGSYTKGFDLGPPDDAVVLPLFKDVERVILSADDADEMGLRLTGTCRPGDSSAALGRSIESYVKMGLAMIDQTRSTDHKADSHDLFFRMTKSLLANIRVEHSDRSVSVKTQGFGRLADLASMIEAEMKSEKKAGNQQAKAAKKTETR